MQKKFLIYNITLKLYYNNRTFKFLFQENIQDLCNILYYTRIELFKFYKDIKILIMKIFLLKKKNNLDIERFYILRLLQLIH